MKRYFSIACVAFSITGLAQSVLASDSRIDSEYLYLQGNAEAVLLTKFSGPQISLGGGVRANGSTDLKTGYGYTFGLGKQWKTEDDNRELTFHRAEVEFVSTSVARKSVTIAERVSATGDVQSNILFLNYLRRVSESEHYRYWVGAGIGLARVKIPDGPVLTADCNCPKGGSESGAAFQIKAVTQRSIKDNLILNGYLAYRNLPGMTSGSTPGTEYKRFSQVSIGLGLEYLFD